MKITGNPCKDGTLPVVIAFLLFFAFCYFVRLYAGKKAETTLHIATTGWGKKIEDTFLTPFIPPSLSSFAAFLGIFSIGLTLPMLWTRYAEGRWMGEFIATQKLPNAISEFVGCKPFDGGNLIYYHYPLNGSPPKAMEGQAEDLELRHDYNEHIDWTVGLHASAGLLWVLLGAIQIFYAERQLSHRTRFHKYFGIAATISLYVHMLGAVHILYRDIVHHNIFPKMMLFSDVLMSSYYIGRGIQLRKMTEGIPNKFMHRTMMFFGFVHAIEGSGQIRFTAWYIWIISRFLPEKVAPWIDTTVCQEMAFPNNFRAAATHCVFPYMVRMNLLRMMTIYFKLIFFRLPLNKGYRKTKDSIAKEMQQQFQAFATSLVAIAVVEFVPTYIRDLFHDNLYCILFFGNQLAARTQVRWIPYAIIATLSFLLSQFVPEGWIDFGDESFYDDVLFGTLTIVVFVKVMHDYTDMLIQNMTDDETTILILEDEKKKAQ